MARILLVVWMSGMVLAAQAQAPRPPDAAAILSSATTALGGANLKTLEFSGNGWDGCLGQAWNVNDGRWARWELRDYNRAIDYETGSSRHTAQQRAGMATPLRWAGAVRRPGQRQDCSSLTLRRTLRGPSSFRSGLPRMASSGWQPPIIRQRKLWYPAAEA
jgi:hypothetical protein